MSDIRKEMLDNPAFIAWKGQPSVGPTGTSEDERKDATDESNEKASE